MGDERRQESTLFKQDARILNKTRASEGWLEYLGPYSSHRPSSLTAPHVQSCA
jgi:hypothetical protein